MKSEVYVNPRNLILFLKGSLFFQNHCRSWLVSAKRTLGPTLEYKFTAISHLTIFRTFKSMEVGEKPLYVNGQQRLRSLCLTPLD